MNNASALSSVPRVDHLLDAAPPATPASRRGRRRHRWRARAVGRELRARPSPATRVPRDQSGGEWTRLTSSPVSLNEYTDASALTRQRGALVRGLVRRRDGQRAPQLRPRHYLRAANISALTLQPVYQAPGGGDAITLPVDVPAAQVRSTARVDILNRAGERVRTIELRPRARHELGHVGRPATTPACAIAPGVYRAWLQMGSTSKQVKLVRQP